MKRALAYIMIFLMIFLNIPSVTTYAEDSDTNESIAADVSNDPNFPELSSQSVIVMDAKSGQILYEKDAHTKKYPASITKILTALVALENGDLDSQITMSEDAVWGIERGSSHIALDVGEQITLEDALYAVMLVSANEAAWGVAEHVGGSLSEFCDMMNEKAKSLGCENTHFVNANGLHDDNHYTTAYDMALITRAAIKNEKFMEITSTNYYEIAPTNKNSETRYLWQDNKLINESSEYYYSYCQGGKTGFTDEAGGTLVAWAKYNDLQLICVTLNASTNSENYADSAALFRYFFGNYTYRSVLSDYEFSAQDLTRAQNYLNDYYNCENAGYLYLAVDNTQKVLLPDTVAEEDLVFTFTPESERITASIIGSLTISYGSNVYAELPVTYTGYINSTDEEAIKEAIANGTIRKPVNTESNSPKWGLIIFIIILVLGIVSFVYLRLKYVRKQREAYIERRNNARERKHRF